VILLLFKCTRLSRLYFPRCVCGANQIASVCDCHVDASGERDMSGSGSTISLYPSVFLSKVHRCVLCKVVVGMSRVVIRAWQIGDLQPVIFSSVEAVWFLPECSVNVYVVKGRLSSDRFTRQATNSHGAALSTWLIVFRVGIYKTRSESP